VKCFFVGYSEYVKGYRLIQPRSNEIIIRRDVKFDENLLASEPNSTFMTYLPCEPYSAFAPSSGPILVSSSDDDGEDENPPPPTHIPPTESIEHELSSTPSLPRCTYST
jgi:hypothetical protein